jgi:hypothetical protein
MAGGGGMSFKIYITFYVDNTRTFAFRQIKFGAVKNHWYACKVLFESLLL